MHKRKIVAYMTVNSLEEMIQKVKDYKQFVKRKTEALRQELAAEIAEEMDKGFRSSWMNDSTEGKRTPQVAIEVRDRQSVSVIVADGEDAVWVEFGAGISYNEHLHSSPHPFGEELNFKIGEYGLGFGQYEYWRYYDKNGEKQYTWGTPASMPMYKAVRSVLERKGNIARRIFGD